MLPDEQKADTPDVLKQQLGYFQDLLRLRRVLRRNELDDLLVAPLNEEGGKDYQILYLVDNNVLGFYVDPGNKKGLTQCLRGKRSARFTSATRDIDRNVACITAEYIFSNRLPGQKQFPLYVDPGHWEEFLSFSRQAIPECLEAEKAVREDPSVAKSVAAFEDTIKTAAGARDIETIKNIYLNEVPNFIHERGLASIVRAQLIRNVLRRKPPLALAPMVRLPYLPEGQALRAPQKLEAFFDKAIRDHDAKREEGRRKSDDARLTDAKCLARLSAINGYYAKNGIPARVVLITADEQLEIVARTQRTEAAEACGGDTFLRSVQQFLPVFNTHDMPNDIDERSATWDIRDAIDARVLRHINPASETTDVNVDRAIEEFDTSVRGHMHMLDLVQRAEWGDSLEIRAVAALRRHFEKLAKDDLGALINENLDILRKDWGTLLETSERANFKLLIRHHRSQLGEISVVAEEINAKIQETLEPEIVEKQRRTTSRMAREHLETTLLSELQIDEASATEWSQRDFGISTDAFAKFNDLEQATRSLVYAIQDGQWRRVRQFAKRLCDNSAPYSVIVYAVAAIAVQSGRWELAMLLASYTTELLRRPDGLGGLTDPEECKILRARAALLGGIADRAQFLQRMTIDRKKDRYQENKRRPADLRSTARELRELGRPLEADLATAEAALWRVALQVSFIATGKDGSSIDMSLVESELRQVATEVGALFDREDDGVETILGGRSLTVVKKRAGTAIAWSKLVSDYYDLRESTPLVGLISAALKSLADSPRKDTQDLGTSSLGSLMEQPEKTGLVVSQLRALESDAHRCVPAASVKFVELLAQKNNAQVYSEAASKRAASPKRTHQGGGPRFELDW